MHWNGFFVVEQSAQVGDNVFWVVVQHLSAPTGTDTIRAVHQHQRKDRDVVFRFNRLAVVVQVLEQWVIVFGEDFLECSGEAGWDEEHAHAHTYDGSFG
jgi:hypothetical protein